MFTIVKIIVSAVIIGAITEIARRNPNHGGIIAALPIVSMLSIVWLYIQGEHKATLSKFAFSVAWGIPSTVVMLVIIGIALRHSIHFIVSIGLGLAGWVIFLFAQDIIVKHLVNQQ
ncbi:DUF3147 family protein [Bacillus nakamurai]|jgi:hypothetical protein|uniref:DUF3147 family protein n=1 Tax=Bacillus nakamurai TaxID=1793963 RepID=A0A150F303_9BACI|nr:DUF3147 family protein [Bacillus nakamurai]KXZ13429.1 hypothetical protein AXI58_04650 [Bacillus nakamurai]MCC9024174.1 DUF3147 family protein [Bacillus nakamurai]MCP6683750.1 DUF3147 family protein [Bacillus nakamurai]MED1227125.1 DUF3147 family protein [Bacillus nakamurai]